MKDATNTRKQKDEVEPENMSKETANTFNEYFASVGKKIQQKLNAPPGDDYNISPQIMNEGFAFNSITSEQVKKIIKSLRPTVATGHCGIPARIFIDLAETISKDLADIINLGYSLGRFPQLMKHAIIKAIFKQKGSSHLPEFYRPISILSIVSKVFEKSATAQIVNYLESNGKLFPGQHAYRKHHSTTTCLVEITE